MKVDEFFSEIAELSSIDGRFTVYFRPKADKVVTWQYAVTHPLEVLENVYSHQVREALRQKKDADLPARIEATQQELSKYFELGETAPQLIGEERPRELEILVLEAVRIVNKIKEGRKEDKENKRSSLPTKQTFRTLEEMEQVFNKNRKIVPETTQQSIDFLITRGSGAGGGSLAGWINDDIETYDLYLKGLGEVAAAFKKSLEHLTIIKINNSIDAFTLLRYYVSYEVRGSQQLLSQNEIRAVSVALTGFLHNTADFGLHKLLSSCLSGIDSALVKDQELQGHVLFYLKGGRALQFFLGTPELGDNDWDCQFLIDPNLSAPKWYEAYRRAQNILLQKMFEVRRAVEAFFLEKADDASGVLSALKVKMNEPKIKDPIRNRIKEGLEPIHINEEIDMDAYLGEYREYQNTKAELIDVGTPRHETVELWEQWHLLHGNLLPGRYDDVAGPSIPPAIYYLNEHLLMVSEVIGKRSKAIAKLLSRIKRLNQILKSYKPSSDDHYFKQLKRETGNDDVEKIARVRFNQIWESFGCDIDPELGKYVIQSFAGVMEARGKFTTEEFFPSLAPDVQGVIKGAKENWTPEIDTFFSCLYKLQMLSGELINAQKLRSDRLVKPLGLEGKKVSPIQLVESAFEKVDTAINSAREERDLLFLYTGGHAANCHYNFLKGRIEALKDYKPEPVPYLTAAIHVVKHQVGKDPALPTESKLFDFVRSLIEDCKIDKVDSEPKVELISDERSFAFYLKVDNNLAGVIKLEFHDDLATVPFVSYVWGRPCLSLKNLVRDYTKRLAMTSDFAVQGSLREALDQVTGIMTEFTAQ